MGKICKNCGAKDHVRGLWSKEEDEKLKKFILVNGEGCWKDVARDAGLLRCGKSCRGRWVNHVNPNIKRGDYTKEEEELIIQLLASGKTWSDVAKSMPGRIDKDVRNFCKTIDMKYKMSTRGINPFVKRPRKSYSVKALANWKNKGIAWRKQMMSANIGEKGHVQLNLELTLSPPCQYAAGFAVAEKISKSHFS